MNVTAEPSPKIAARVAGVFYLLVFVTGIAALVTGGRFVISGDPATTARNILTHESLFRAGWTFNLMATVCYVVVTALFYELFRIVNRALSLTAALFSLVGCAISGVSSIFQFAALVILKGSPYARAFTPEQLQSMAYLFLRVNGGNIALFFFGFYCVLIGCLIFQSTFLPRALGGLMLFAGLGWLTSSFSAFLFPPLATFLAYWIFLPGVIGEGALTLWLLVMGVNVQRWTQQTGALPA